MALALNCGGAIRPRYGGVLRIQSIESPAAEMPPLVAETLVRIDDRGDAAPGLAVAWQHDAAYRRWRFTLRQRVVFHDGTPFTAAIAAPLLAAVLGVNVTPSGQHLVVPLADPDPNLPFRLAHPRTALARRASDGTAIGTGPFRVVKFEAGRRLTLAAFEDHWAGRPYLDGVEIASQSPRADVTQVSVTVSRRLLPDRTTPWLSPVRELIALQMTNVHPVMREAIALTVDRDSIANVITQRRGEPARALLPEWLSGYAFLFTTDRDTARARQLAQTQKAAPMTIAVPPGDPLARTIADRIALNGRDAGIVMTVAAQAGEPNMRLIRLRLPSSSAPQSIAEFARLLGSGDKVTPVATPQSLYDSERALLADHAVLPIVYVPDVYAVTSRVHAWDPRHIENVWIEP